MRETPFKEKVEALLLKHNAWFIKYWAGARYTKEGIPDVLACINGTFYGLELKGDGGKPRILQLIKLRDIRNSGGIGLLLYPKDLKEFEQFISDPYELKNFSAWYRDNIELQKIWYEKLKL